jgi:2-methylcitrate dehydratase
MSVKYTVDKIAAFVDGCTNEAVPPDVRELVAKHLLDSIGCAIGAIGSKVTEDIMAVVDAFGGKPMCTLIGGGLTSPDRAALYNGCLVRYLDFMDAYLRPEEVNHPCDNIMAILAAAEHVGSSGKDFATALAIAFEIQNHLLDLPTMRASINYTTPLAFSVAAGVSKVLGLDAAHTANALAIAGVGAVSCAVIQAEPVSNWKGLASGESASRALHNAYLAQTGITGTPGVFDGPHGLFQIVRDHLDTDWTTEWFAYAQRSSIKKYNAEFQSQSAVDLAIDLRNNHKIEVEKINSMHVEVAQGAYDVLAGGTYGPKTECRIKEQADHNLMYLLSVALLDGEIWPPQFTTERINRDDVQSLMRKVTAAPNDDFSRRLGPQMPASLSIELEGGEVIKGEKGVFDGFWATPMTWDQVRAKFDRLTDGRVDKALGAELAAAAQNIDKIAVKDLTALLGRVSRPLVPIVSNAL